MSTPGTRNLLLPVAATAILLAGCDGSVSGTATPNSPSPSAPANSSASTNPFASRNQCALLDQILAGKGFPKATPSVAQPQRSCASQKPSVGTTHGMDVGLFLQDGRPYDDDIANTARRGDVNGRPSVEQAAPLGPPGQCEITMAVAPGSRAILLVTNGSDTDASCKIVEELATQLEPLLPPA